MVSRRSQPHSAERVASPTASVERDWPAWARTLMTQMPVGLAFVDASGRISFVNAQLAAALGVATGTLLGRNAADALPANATADTASRPHKISVDGNDRWVQVTRHDLRAEGNPDVAEAIVVVDVTDRRKAELVAETTQQRLTANLAAMERLHALSTQLAATGGGRSLLKAILAAAIKVTGALKGLIVLVEPETDELRIAAQQGFSSRCLATLLSDGAPALSRTAFESGERFTVENLLDPPVGTEPAHVEALLTEGIRAAVSVPVPQRPGGTRGILSVHFAAMRRLDEDEMRLLDLLVRMMDDFLERADAERALRLSEERFRALGTTTAQLFFRMAPDWLDMTEVNGASARGAMPPNLHWLQDHVHPDDQERVRRQIKVAIEVGAPLELEFRRRVADGATRWSLMRAVPLRDAERRISEWFGSVTDITERKAASEALRHYHDQLEERVAARVADLDSLTEALRGEILKRGREQRMREELLRQLNMAQEAERRRISRELHDEVGQQLAALLLGLNELAEEFRVPPDSPALSRVQAIAQTIGTEIHNLAVELRPTSLDDTGLARALDAYAQNWSGRTKVRADFHATGFEGRRLPNALETTLYRIVQEALTNVKKHAQARTVGIILEWKEHEVSLIVEDDGVGFDADAPRKPNRLGLLGMKERMVLVGGEVRVESSPGAGTTVMVRVPLAPRKSE